MRYRPLGQSGLLVSVVGLGCNNFGSRLDVEGTRAVVDAAIDAGITLFDTSDTYGGGGGSERALGEILGSRRDQVVLATKFGGKGVDMGYGPAVGAKGGRSYIRRAVAESLRRLRTDHIDLYQLHVPDPVTPVEETLAALDELVTEARSGISAIRTSPAGSWPAPRTSRRATAVPRSSRRRITGRCSRARPRPKWSRQPGTSAWACCPSSRWPTAC
jgi:aryl-alcohol dehydrogenase-like predicted oxidoreductase